MLLWTCKSDSNKLALTNLWTLLYWLYCITFERQLLIFGRFNKLPAGTWPLSHSILRTYIGYPHLSVLHHSPGHNYDATAASLTNAVLASWLCNMQYEGLPFTAVCLWLNMSSKGVSLKFLLYLSLWADGRKRLIKNARGHNLLLYEQRKALCPNTQVLHLIQWLSKAYSV